MKVAIVTLSEIGAEGGRLDPEHYIAKRELRVMPRTLVEALPDGHRLFKNDHDHYAIADESGPLPEATDDGVLWLDRNRPLDATGQSCAIPLTDADGKATRTPSNAATVLLLAGRFNWPIRIDGATFHTNRGR